MFFCGWVEATKQVEAVEAVEKPEIVRPALIQKAKPSSSIRTESEASEMAPPTAPPAASPMASPVASPVASPAASPVKHAADEQTSYIPTPVARVAPVTRVRPPVAPAVAATVAQPQVQPAVPMPVPAVRPLNLSDGRRRPYPLPMNPLQARNRLILQGRMPMAPVYRPWKPRPQEPQQQAQPATSPQVPTVRKAKPSSVTQLQPKAADIPAAGLQQRSPGLLSQLAGVEQSEDGEVSVQEPVQEPVLPEESLRSATPKATCQLMAEGARGGGIVEEAGRAKGK